MEIFRKLVLQERTKLEYYTYIMNLKSRYAIENSIQYGTCRMTIEGDVLFSENYWKTQKPKGDVMIKKKLK